MISTDDKALLSDLFHVAVAAADPKKALAPHLPVKPKGKTVVIGAGKGAAHLAAAFEELWGDPVQGVVVTRYGFSTACKSIQVMEASHPVPDAAGLRASKALKAAVSGLGEDDLVVALVCGGGSALLPDPQDGLTLEDEVALNEALLASGAPISAMNAIRKQFSQIKGGRLALAAYPAKVVSLVVSDVPGDDPAQVASGPTVPDPSSPEKAKALISAYGINLPENLRAHLDQAAPAPDPQHEAFNGHGVNVVASACISLEAAAKASAKMGIPAVILSDAIEGEANDVGQVLAAMAREVALRDRPFPKPVVLLSGGETTVTISNKGGRGGRNTECLLSFAKGIEDHSGITALMADTDGIDGSEDNAGAFADGDSNSRLRQAGLDPAAVLSAHDAWGAFDAIDDLFVPGPTGTNVNDFRAILIR